MYNPAIFFYVGGGLIGAALALFIARHFFVTTPRNNYRQRVKTANNEILSSIRPLIADKVFPPSDIVGPVIAATATKYSVDLHDLYDPNSLASDMIKEIVDNPFLSSPDKIEYANLVSGLRGTRSVHLYPPEFAENKTPIS